MHGYNTFIQNPNPHPDPRIFLKIRPNTSAYKILRSVTTLVFIHHNGSVPETDNAHECRRPNNRIIHNYNKDLTVDSIDKMLHTKKKQFVIFKEEQVGVRAR